jgi:hypothetical protein
MVLSLIGYGFICRCGWQLLTIHGEQLFGAIGVGIGGAGGSYVVIAMLNGAA